MQTFWPPRDPTRESNPHKPSESSQNKAFKLPESPWTFGGDGFNPTLHASNTQIRYRKRPANGDGSGTEGNPSGEAPTPSQNFPPYHPSYRSAQVAHSSRSQTPEESSADDGSADDSADDFQPLRPDASTRVGVRLGAEGWEVRQYGSIFQISDEETTGRGPISGPDRRLEPPPRADRYQRYVSEEPSSEESEEDNGRY